MFKFHSQEVWNWIKSLVGLFYPSVILNLFLMDAKDLSLNEQRDQVSDLCVCVFLGGGVHQMEAVLADAKNQTTSEILRRVEMENQVQTLREQLELQKNISEQVRY